MREPLRKITYLPTGARVVFLASEEVRFVRDSPLEEAGFDVCRWKQVGGILAGVKCLSIPKSPACARQSCHIHSTSARVRRSLGLDVIMVRDRSAGWPC
jgi:hypothetical protein